MSSKGVEGGGMKVESTVGNTPKSTGCSHYKRNCRLVAPCCSKVYPCRVCHDEEESHSLDRKLVQELECSKCNARSPIRSDCGECGLTFGDAYFCLICRLFDHVDKGQFHCEECGICRVGGQSNYQHCVTCGLCMPTSRSHKCIEKSSSNNCPICFEGIHSSRTEATIPPCGHLIHTPCYKKMLKKGLYSCPSCGKALLDMSTAWRQIDREVASTPMPAAYQELYRKVLCKDCSRTSDALFHVVGMKCVECGSYNTSVEGPFTRRNSSGEGFIELSDAELERLYAAGPDTDGTAHDNVEEQQQDTELLHDDEDDTDTDELSSIVDIDDDEEDDLTSLDDIDLSDNDVEDEHDGDDEEQRLDREDTAHEGQRTT